MTPASSPKANDRTRSDCFGRWKYGFPRAGRSSAFAAVQAARRPFHIRKIGLDLPKEELHRRIHDRVDHMIEQGLVEEAKGLLPYRNHNALRTVGYREIFGYLDGHCSLDEAIVNIKTNTRRYAKRQLTWFRKDPGIQWMHPDDPIKN
jgi:tRNA dimethylallyltransferase